MDRATVIFSEHSQLELGCVSGVNPNGRTIWITDAHRNNGKRFIVRAGEKLTAFLELEATIPFVGNLC
jgi:hypothetical protein